MAALGRPLQQKQEALHGTGRDPSHSAHESNRAHPGAAQDSSGLTNKVRKGRREGGDFLPSFVLAHLYV